jgi:DNA-directed RNA polymerase specialized sigma24 family protein
MRRRLVSYFDRKRCRTPDDLADETLNRVTRRLEEQGSITDTSPAHYCYIVAKFVLLEHLRDPGARWVASVEPAVAAAETGSQERRFQCLDRCLAALDRDDRELILDYYRGEQRAKIDGRRQLAAKLAMTANALAIRACRIRGKLEQCVKACSAAPDHDRFRPVSSQ